MANTPRCSECLAGDWTGASARMQLATHSLEIGIGGHSIARCDDVEIGAGDILVLIGKNGSGKSTYLRSIGGLLKPMMGEIIFDGKLMGQVSIEKTAAWLSQEEHCEFSWTVREYVSLGRIAYNSGLVLSQQDEQAVDLALAQTGSEELSGRFIHELSGGERQRVRLARALAQDTPILLMDEPTTHLDLEHQIQFLGLIHELAKHGKTIVVSLHDVFQATFVGTKFLLFRANRASVVNNQDQLTKERLEETLGVRFEPFGDSGQLMPTYCRTID